MQITYSDISFNVDATGYEPYWNSVAAGSWEPTTLDVINKLQSGETFIDCGGWIGALTLAAASKGANVVVYEPNPIAATMLQNNIDINPGFDELVTVKQQALNTYSGKTKLFNSKVLGFNNSRSTLTVQEGLEIEVPSVSIKEALTSDRWSDATLVKLDVEGTEFQILPDLCEHLKNRSIALLVEFHPTYFESKTLNSSVLDECTTALSSWQRRLWVSGTLTGLHSDTCLQDCMAGRNTPVEDMCPKILFEKDNLPRFCNP